MELKPGYKQTEVGVIPEDWEVKLLGELSSVTAGGTPSRTNSKYWNGNISWITTSEVDFCTISHSEQFITKKGLDNSAAKLLPSGTLLMALYGQGKTRGKVAILGIEAASNQACAAILLKSNVSRYFIYHYLASQYDAIRKLSNTGNQENLNSSLVRSILIALPSPPEQKAIATALSDINNLLGVLDRLIAKKQNLKQSAMQELLTGQTRLPGFNEDWDIKRLEDLADIISGGTPKTSNQSYWDGDIKWCTPTDITSCKEKYLIETERTISQIGLNSSGTQLLPPGTLLLCSRATIGEIKIAGCEICTNQGFKSLVCYSGINNEFLYYKLLMMKPQMIERAFGSTFLEISKTNVAALELSIPNSQEQKAIANILSDIDTEIAALKKRRDKTHNIKQAMMQELLTGKTRLIAPGGNND